MLLSLRTLFGHRVSIRRRSRIKSSVIEAMEIRLLLTTLPTQLPGDLNAFRLWSDTSQTTPGLTGSYVNSSLRDRAVQDDWRVTQTISEARLDAAIAFETQDWGTRSSVGITGGVDSDWDDFSVQWDGYIEVLVNGTTLWTRSDDSSRFWIDLNGDGKFDTFGPEFVDNNGGIGQPVTDGNLSVPIDVGRYRIRLQYEEVFGGNSIHLKSGPQNRLRVAYLIPSNREPQVEGVANLQYNVMNYQRWLADQMDRQGFGRKTFAYETEANGVTPRIHVLRLPNQDTAYRRDDSLDAEGLRDNRTYDGLILPTYGPYPLAQDLSFPWFEGTTVSSIASSFVGAMLHEMLHGFGVPHDSRNDDNFHGNVMGIGLRGWRGYAYPGLYPEDTMHLQRASAVRLNTSRYLHPIQTFSDSTAPVLTINGAASFVSGQVRINFSASDTSQLRAAILIRDGESIGEMVLAGTSVTTTFDTPYYEAGIESEFAIEVFDSSGNRTRSSLQFTPPVVGSRIVRY